MAQGEGGAPLPAPLFFILFVTGPGEPFGEKLGDMVPVLEKCKSLLPPQVSDQLWVPYLGHGLDAGMQTLFCFDMEARRQLEI